MWMPLRCCEVIWIWDVGMFGGMFEVMFGVSLWEKSIEELRRVRCSSLLIVARIARLIKMSTMILGGE